MAQLLVINYTTLTDINPSSSLLLNFEIVNTISQGSQAYGGVS